MTHASAASEGTVAMDANGVDNEKFNFEPAAAATSWSLVVSQADSSPCQQVSDADTKSSLKSSLTNNSDVFEPSSVDVTATSVVDRRKTSTCERCQSCKYGADLVRAQARLPYYSNTLSSSLQLPRRHRSYDVTSARRSHARQQQRRHYGAAPVNSASEEDVTFI